jgi:Fur family peroxide stress response transcriptional regulator
MPGIGKGTVYHILDTLSMNKIISRVKTDNDIMRYDGITESHHHLYCSECDTIEDYFDADLDELLRLYFKDKKIPGFELENVVLQIRGTFNKCQFSE